MKILLTIATMGLCLATISHAQSAEQLRILELERKMEELQKEKEKLAKDALDKERKERPQNAGPSETFDAEGRLNVRISNAVLVIEGDQSVGTGFVVSTGGKYYVYTAAHVLSGNTKLTIRNNAGITFRKFGPLETAEGADLVRLEILGGAGDSLELRSPDEPLLINTPIAALGNGGGVGIIAVERGSILGISADSLEVDAGIIQGNSGGPVVEEASGKAVGLVTHLTDVRKDKWSEGTRQANIRRFACRLNKEWTWKAMNIGTFLANARTLEDFENNTQICVAVCRLGISSNLQNKFSRHSQVSEVLHKNSGNPVVKSLLEMSSEVVMNRKTSLSEAEVKKKIRSLLGQLEGQMKRSHEALKPQTYCWFHRTRGEAAMEERVKAVTALNQELEALK